MCCDPEHPIVNIFSVVFFFHTQEEKEKAKAQKDEVVTQMTEVLESELQCSICSELFIEVQYHMKNIKRSKMSIVLTFDPL